MLDYIALYGNGQTVVIGRWAVDGGDASFVQKHNAPDGRMPCGGILISILLII